MGAGQLWLRLGAVCGGTGVLLGAFGAHALKSQLTEPVLQTWHTAVSYQLIHALALLVTGVWLRTSVAGAPERALRFAGGAFVVGVVFFSGSLYLLALGGPRWLGPVTPVGGLAFIAGWIALARAALRPAAAD